MFCNNCGRDNKEGVRFCVQCGAPVMPVQPKQRTSYASGSGAPAPGVLPFKLSNTHKKLIVAAAAVILVLTALFNVRSVNKAVYNAQEYSSEQTANGISGIAETNSYVYYTYDGALYRADKARNTAEKIANRNVSIVSAAKDGLYCRSNGDIYRFMDKGSELESVMPYVSYSDFFIRGRCNYALTEKGGLKRRLNTNKFVGYVNTLREDNSDYEILTARMYENYLYVSIADSSISSRSGYRFSRISLDSGKEELLSDEEITTYWITGGRIVYMKGSSGGFTGGSLYTMDLNGKNQRELIGVDITRRTSFLCANGSIYAYDSGSNVIRKYDLNGQNERELDGDIYVNVLGTGFAEVEYGSLMLYDYDMNNIAKIRP